MDSNRFFVDFQKWKIKYNFQQGILTPSHPIYLKEFSNNRYFVFLEDFRIFLYWCLNIVGHVKNYFCQFFLADWHFPVNMERLKTLGTELPLQMYLCELELRIISCDESCYRVDKWIISSYKIHLVASALWIS